MLPPWILSRSLVLFFLENRVRLAGFATRLPSSGLCPVIDGTSGTLLDYIWPYDCAAAACRNKHFKCVRNGGAKTAAQY